MDALYDVTDHAGLEVLYDVAAAERRPGAQRGALPPSASMELLCDCAAYDGSDVLYDVVVYDFLDSRHGL